MKRSQYLRHNYELGQFLKLFDSFSSRCVFKSVIGFHHVAVFIWVTVPPTPHHVAGGRSYCPVKWSNNEVGLRQVDSDCLDALLCKSKSYAGGRSLYRFPLDYLKQTIPEQTFLCSVKKFTLGT